MWFRPLRFPGRGYQPKTYRTTRRPYSVIKIPDGNAYQKEANSLVPAPPSGVSQPKATAVSALSNVFTRIKKFRQERKQWVAWAKDAIEKARPKETLVGRLQTIMHERLDAPTPRFLEQERMSKEKKQADNSLSDLKLSQFALSSTPIILTSSEHSKYSSTSQKSNDVVVLPPPFEPFPRLRLSVRIDNERQPFMLRKLPYEITTTELWRIFRRYRLAPIDQPIQLVHAPTRHPTGFAYVYFATTGAAALARRQLNLRWVGKRYLIVDFDFADKPKPRVQRFPLHIIKRGQLPIPHVNFG